MIVCCDWIKYFMNITTGWLLSKKWRLDHEVIHRLPKAGTLNAEPVATGSNTAQVKIVTEQTELIGNCYVPTGNFNWSNTLPHMTVRAQTNFCCASWKAETFSILNTTPQVNAHVLFRSHRLSINCFLPVAVFTFWPQDVLQTNGAQRCIWRYDCGWPAGWQSAATLHAHFCNHHAFHNAVTGTV